MKRRIADRSVVTRESSWPDCHRRVEAHRQRLQPLVEVAAQVRLETEDRVGLDPPAHEDEHGLEDAEPEGEETERQDAAPARAASIGPSMIAWVTSGIAMDSPTPASDTANMTVRAQRWGRR